MKKINFVFPDFEDCTFEVGEPWTIQKNLIVCKWKEDGWTCLGHSKNEYIPSTEISHDLKIEAYKDLLLWLVLLFLFW